MTEKDDEILRRLNDLKAAIRNVVHDVSNPLGVLRMSAYYLQNGAPDRGKEAHYLTVMGESIEKIAAGLALLRDMSDDSPGASPPRPSAGELA
ncbi:MAG TPA: hypothetical protein VMM80_01690 [Bacteroidota bacterium]|nr:hypothetical protein [Bacteroidota bacterium]